MKIRQRAVKKKLKLDRNEHSECRWILPEEIKNFDCAAGTKKDFESVGLA